MTASRLAAVLAATALMMAAAAPETVATPARDSTTQASSGHDGAFGVTASLRPSSVLKNERAVLSGVVKPVPSSKMVQIQQKDGSGWTTVTKRDVNDDGEYRYAFESQEAGTFTYRARMPKVGQIKAGHSRGQTLTVAEEALVVFKIKSGTSSGAWNTEASTVDARVGDTLRITNNDMMAHRPHTEGDPFPNPGASESIEPGESRDYVLETAYDSSPGHTLYCAIHGQASHFWIDVVEP